MALFAEQRRSQGWQSGLWMSPWVAGCQGFGPTADAVERMTVLACPSRTDWATLQEAIAASPRRRRIRRNAAAHSHHLPRRHGLRSRVQGVASVPCCRSQPDAGGNHDHADDQRRPDGFVLGPRGDRNAEARCSQECHRHRAGRKAPPGLHDRPVGESGRYWPHIGQRCGTLSAHFLQRRRPNRRAVRGCGRRPYGA